MLIDKGVSSGEVVTIKLTSGEELIASLISEDEKYIKVSKPRVLTSGAQGLGMAPYLFTVSPDKDIKLSRVNVTVLEPTDADTAKQYTSATSGIAMI